MAEKDNIRFEDILDRIAHYQDVCLICPNYRRKECGFVFPDKRLPKGTPLFIEIYRQMEYDERVVFDTQQSGEPCKDQVSNVVFLHSIEEDLDKTLVGFDEYAVVGILQKAYRILHKYDKNEPLFKHTTIRSDVQKAIDLVMAHVDLECIRHGVSPYRLIQSADIGYNRESGLFAIFPREMAVSLMGRAIVRDNDGYFESDGSFDARVWDIARRNYIGPNWIDVVYYRSQNHSDYAPAQDIHSNHSEMPSVPSDIITDELQALIDAGIIDESLQLMPRQSRRSLVQYCHENGLYKPWLLENWRAIDDVITDQKGNKIPAQNLKQAFQDYQKNYVLQ